jgi:hypothetical protein
MHKSIFAGLTILDADESVLEDSGAFIGRDRELIDRMLEIGAKTHRHDGSDGLLDPVTPVGASAVASGGQIPADLSFSIGYTVEDDQGGETLISPIVTVATPSQIEIPLNSPVGEAEYDNGGDLLADTYYYALSYTDDEGGETPVGPSVSVEREPGYSAAKINLSALTEGMVAAGATGWRLYRAVGGGDYHFLAAGTGATYTDDGSDSVNCDITPLTDETNTTNGDNSIIVALPSADVRIAPSDALNLYVSPDGTFSGDVLVDTFPVGSAGQEVVYRYFDFLTGQPPDVNTSIGGASKIDPDVEILDWHWKRPAINHAALGSGMFGDVKMTLNDGQIYSMLTSPSGTVWRPLASAASATIFAEDADGPEITGIGKLVFTGSGGTGVSVEDLGGGSARVLISGGAGGGGGGGMGASALLDVTDEDGPVVADIGQLSFAASGGAVVGVTDEGSGEALVTIYAEEGAQGPPGLSDNDTVFSAYRNAALSVATWAEIVFDTEDFDVSSWYDTATGRFTPQVEGYYSLRCIIGYIASAAGKYAWALLRKNGTVIKTLDLDWSAIASTVLATGETTVYANGIDDDFSIEFAHNEGGSKALLTGREYLRFEGMYIGAGPQAILPSRAWASATAAGLASGAEANVTLTGSAGVRLLKLTTNQKARIRAYGTADARTADAARAPETDPTGDHGVLLDFMATTTDREWTITPAVDAHNLDEPAANSIYLRITNYDATGDTVVGFLYLPTEAV